MELETGQLIAERYEVLGRVGSDANGEVYRVRDQQDQEVRALKVIHDAAARNAILLETFRRQVRVARALAHPNLARVYELGDYQGSPFLVTELVVGESLAYYMARTGPISADILLPIAGQICAALDFLHRQNIIHRDVKPASFVFAPDGSLKLRDFGMARELDGQMTIALPGAHSAHLSPEQLLGRKLDPRSDIYSAGRIFFELLAGRPPHAGVDVIARYTQPPPLVTKFAPETPSHVSAAINRCLQPEMEQRFNSISEVLDALTGSQEDWKIWEATRERAREKEQISTPVAPSEASLPTASAGNIQPPAPPVTPPKPVANKTSISPNEPNLPPAVNTSQLRVPAPVTPPAMPEKPAPPPMHDPLILQEKGDPISPFSSLNERFIESSSSAPLNLGEPVIQPAPPVEPPVHKVRTPVTKAPLPLPPVAPPPPPPPLPPEFVVPAARVEVPVTPPPVITPPPAPKPEPPKVVEARVRPTPPIQPPFAPPMSPTSAGKTDLGKGRPHETTGAGTAKTKPPEKPVPSDVGTGTPAGSSPQRGDIKSVFPTRPKPEPKDDSKSLRKKIGEAPGKPAEVVRMLLAVTQKLDEILKAGTYHAPLTPATIHLKPSGVEVESAPPPEAGKTLVVSESKYLAPECLFSRPVEAKAITQSDIYSLGFISFEWLMGQDLFAKQFPFEDLSQSSFEWMRWHGDRASTLAPPAELAAWIPAMLSKLIQRMLAKDAAQRPASYEALIKELEDIRHRIEDTDHVIHVPTIENLGDQGKSKARKFSLSALTRWPGILLLFLVIALIGALVGFLLKPQ